MKKHIDRITETCIHLSEQLKERDTLSFGDCDAVELLINDMQLELEHIRCELYEIETLLAKDYEPYPAGKPEVLPELFETIF